ncbi:MAG: ATP-binding protein [Thermoanaerobaculia bacterium]
MVLDNQKIIENLLNISEKNLSRIEFLKETLKILKKFSPCHKIEILFCSNGKITKIREKSVQRFKISGEKDKKILEIITKNKEGFYEIDKNIHKIFVFSKEIEENKKILIVFKDGNEIKIKKFEILLKIIVLILSKLQIKHSLKERVKELSCLYRFLELTRYEDLSIKDFLKKVVDIIPFAWQYPEITTAKIKIDHWTFYSSNFKKPLFKQKSCIKIENIKRGFIEVGYLEKKAEEDEGPFLKEERDLLENISNYVSFFIQRKEAEIQKIELEKNLQQADRISTIGILSSGLAHELNEPLNTILGFSEVAMESIKGDSQAKEDIQKIKKAALHMREIIKKLSIFARQEMPQKGPYDINNLILETLSFLEKKFEKENIRVELNLDKNLKPLNIDANQIRQVFLNLILNAFQAMPQGGSLKIKTGKKAKEVFISFEDTGIGIKKEDLSKIFLPFYTTKEVGKGTGLGLPVSLGIIKAHKGKIEVKSIPGRGSKFKVFLPYREASL